MNKVLSFLMAMFCTLFAFGQGTIEFVENKGQWDNRVLYKGDVSNGAVFVRNTGITFVQQNPVDVARYMNYKHQYGATTTKKENEGPEIIRFHSWHVDFVGSSANCRIIPSKLQQHHNN